MAKPIKETPFLKGNDAKVFKEANRSVKKISDRERKSINESYENLKRIATFAF